MFLANKLNKGGSLTPSIYQISRSLRFNSADTAYLTRTPAGASNQKTWTWSGWVKRSALGPNQTFFNAGGNGFVARFNSSTDYLEVYNYSGAYQLQVLTAQVFRDVSAWYHIVIAIDTTQATDTNRFKLYVNGSQVTSFYGAPTYPSPSVDLFVNGTGVHALGVLNTVGQYYDGYMTEVNFIDGTQLTSSSFGETNAQTGVWQPKAYSGSYGTNGFYLNFSDNSNTTAATLGKDYSGNGNNWLPTGFSVSTGSGNDSLVDVPTPYGVDTGVGGEVRGNYCTLNPLFIPKSGGVIAAISNGNLDAATNNSKVAFGTMQIPSTGKWYFEFTCNTFQYPSYGIGTSSALGGGYADAMFGFYQQGSNLQFNIGNNSATGTSSGIVSQAGDIALVCVDMDNGKIWMGRDRSGTVTWSGGGTPAVSSPTWSAAGQGGVWSTNFDTTSGWFPLVSSGGTDTWSCNFGQRPFAYTAPSGFKALCTQNLPTPTIGATTATQAGKFFNPVLYTGTGASSQPITGVGFAPDFVWIKSRSSITSHSLFDQIRGAQKWLGSNSTNSEQTYAGTLDAFGSDGFTVGNDTWTGGANTYVAWNWKANGSGSSNTAGSITSTVSANTTSGFSVVTYTGNATSNQTFGHGLGAKVDFAIIKSRSAVSSPAWMVWHRSVCSGNGKALALEETNAIQGPFGTPIWDSSNTSTQASSTTFTIGANTTINASGATYVAYCFAEVAGYSAFGSYTGNGFTDGPFVFTGFRPAYVMIKVASAAAPWLVFDAIRNTSNAADNILYPNTSGAEDKGVGTNPIGVDFLSNGFKIRTTDAWANYNGQTIIYAAFATSPFKYSLAR